MKNNVGSFDKIARIVIGLAGAYYGYANESMWGLLAIIPLGTALMGSCPLYSIFGIGTCKVAE